MVNHGCVQYVSKVAYSYAPLLGHKIVTLTLSGCKSKNNSLCEYYNDLLSNFVNQVWEIAEQMFGNKQMTYIKK